MNPDNAADLRRFSRWAGWVRRVSRPFAAIECSPTQMPSLDRPMVLVANHRSLFDVFVAIDALDRYNYPARCLVRQRYMARPGVGHALRAVGCIAAGDGTGQSIGEAVDTLEAGMGVAVMAEGRITLPHQRDADGMGEFRPGFVTIARKVGVSIQPIGITGTDVVWPRGSAVPRPRFGRRPTVDVRLGEVIEIGDMLDEEVVATTRAAIADLLTDRPEQD